MRQVQLSDARAVMTHNDDRPALTIMFERAKKKGVILWFTRHNVSKQ